MIENHRAFVGRSAALLAAFAGGLLAMAACHRSSGSPLAHNVLVRVGQNVLTVEQVEAQVEHLSTSSGTDFNSPEAQKVFLDKLADQEILAAIAELGRIGVFAEPAGAAAYAGLVKGSASGLVGSEDPILVMNTGCGLKDTGAAMRAVQSAPIIEPTLEAVKKLL